MKLSYPILYHNPKCSKSRTALAYLETQNINIQIIHYLNEKEQLTEIDFKRIAAKLDCNPNEMMRDNTLFNAAVLVHHPELLQRPILELKESATIGRPLDRIQKLLFN